MLLSSWFQPRFRRGCAHDTPLLCRLTCASNRRLLWLFKRLPKPTLCPCLRTPTWLPSMPNVSPLSCRPLAMVMFIAYLQVLLCMLSNMSIDLCVSLTNPSAANPRILLWPVVSEASGLERSLGLHALFWRLPMRRLSYTYSCVLMHRDSLIVFVQ